MSQIPFNLVDVFAEQKLQGNQLAVFDLAGGLDTELMQAIAKETNLAETTFITGSSTSGFDVRIFTTEYEMPFAGHPTIGTAAVIAKKYNVDGPIILNLKIGPVKVYFNKDVLHFCLSKGELRATFSPLEIAELFKVNVDDIGINPIQVSSTGYPFLMIPFSNLHSLQSASVEAGLAMEFLKKNSIHKSNAPDGYTVGFFCYCTDAIKEENDMHSRMFLLQDNMIFEDPATGSAHTAFIFYALEHKLFGDRFKFQSEQGFEMGRPSVLYIEGSYEDNIPQIRLGGKVQFVAEGMWDLS